VDIHANARLTVVRREELVRRVASGEAPRGVAATLGVSVRTVYKWLRRQANGDGLRDRSSRPRRSPTALQAELVEQVAMLRRQRLTGRRIAGHRAHGDRRRATRGIGWEFVHVCIDDASRIAFPKSWTTSVRRAWLLSFHRL